MNREEDDKEPETDREAGGRGVELRAEREGGGSEASTPLH